VDILDSFDATSWGDLFSRMSAPLIRIVLILVAALLLLRLAKRGLRKWVEQIRRGDPSVLQRLEERTGIDLADEVDPIVRVRRERRASALAALAGSVITVVIWSIAVMMVLAQIGVNLGPILASAGIVGVAVGFGAQDLVKDFLSGVFILAEDQYGVGDVVDVGEATGVVEGVTLRSTRLRDVQGTLWHVPNGEIRRVGNMSQGWARTLIDIDVAYDTDLEDAKQVILETAQQMADEDPWNTKFLEPPEVWGVEQFGPDGITIRMVIKVLPGEQWGISRELRQRVKTAFDTSGIEIPFPQRTLWVREGSSPVAPKEVSEARDAMPASGAPEETDADVDSDEVESR
jgi:small conductance mechanosensitive channel